MQKYILIIVMLVFVSSCSNSNSNSNLNLIKFEGMVVTKEKTNNNSYSVLVVSGITADDIKNQSLKDIIDHAQEKNSNGNPKGYFFYINEKQYENVEIGQMVSVFYKGPVQDSGIPQVGASKIEIVE